MAEVAEVAMITMRDGVVSTTMVGAEASATTADAEATTIMGDAVDTTLESKVKNFLKQNQTNKEYSC